MPFIYAPPPAIIAATLQRQPPPLKFLGFQLGMPFLTAQAFIKASGGSLTCKQSSSPSRPDCTGTLPYPGLNVPLQVRIASVGDSVTLIVLTARTPERGAPSWASALREDYGAPQDDMQRGIQQRWQWSRGSQMLRIVERKGGKDELEASMTLGSAPLPELPVPPKPTRPD